MFVLFTSSLFSIDIKGTVCYTHIREYLLTYVTTWEPEYSWKCIVENRFILNVENYLYSNCKKGLR